MAPASIDPVLTVAALVGACVWVGGFVTIVIVVRVARAELAPDVQVAFFKRVGRPYAVVTSCALALALGTGAGLLTGRRWDGVALAAVCVAGVLVLALIVGIVQARGLSRSRRALLGAAGDHELARRVKRGALLALVLRAALVVLSFGLLALSGVLAATSG